MNTSPFANPWKKTKTSLAPPLRKAPANIDWEAIAPKKAQASSGSSKYMEQLREQDPWPTPSDKNTNNVTIFNCRFLSPDDLVTDESCTVACDVKILNPPTSREIRFRLQYRMADADPWTDLNESGKAGVKTNPPDQTAQTDLTLYSPMPAPDLGTIIQFRVVASHSEAAADAEGQSTPVPLRNLCRYIGAPEIVFANDSSCPTLDASGGLIQALGAAVNQLSVPQPMGPQTVVVFGFASSSGTPDHDRELSLWRAQSIQSLLDRDPDAWGDLATAHFTTVDIQQILSGLTQAYGWPCDPGDVDGMDGPDTQSAVQAFQGECNTRYSLGLTIDGICGPETWKAVHRALCAAVAESLGPDPNAEPSWPDVPWGYADGQGAYACGSDFAAPDDEASDRHAEIHFYESNMEPKLKANGAGGGGTDVPADSETGEEGQV
jgi:outer membrane protein OmpA-like peptidoglycan-associated protein